MDANTLIYAQIPLAMDVGEYNDMLSAMETAYLTAHPNCGSSVPVAAVLLHDAKSRTSPRFTATQMGEFVILSQQLLKRLAELQREHRMRKALREQLARYEAVCLGGENEGVWDPTMEDMITLSESFHPCVAVPRKWAQEVRHKCSCAHFAKEAYCKHAVLLAMLMDPTVKPQAEDDIRVINQRKASKQRRAQKWQLVGDEEETVVRKKPREPPRSTARAFVASIEALGFRGRCV